MRIGVIGMGIIASALVEGLARGGHQITVSRRNATRSARLAQRFPEVSVAENQAVLDQSDVVFLGLMAGKARDILDPLKFRPDQKVVSLMADITLDKVATIVAPAQAAAVMIPFPNIAQGGSPILVRGDTQIPVALFGRHNTIIDLPTDAELAAYVAAQAVLSPAVQMVADAARWLGSRVSDAGQGEAFLRGLVGSCLQGAQCAPLLAALNTPGGYNQRLRNHMDASGTSAALIDGLDRLERGE